MRRLEGRVTRLESQKGNRGIAFMAVLRAMNTDQPESPEAGADLERAADAFRAACGPLGNPQVTPS